MDCTSASPPPSGAAFLADLAAAGPVKQRVAMVVAHPDDEAIGAGGQLHRFENLILVFGTDGAPRDGRDADRTGIGNVDAYAKKRSAELTQALQGLQLAEHSIIRLDLPNGELIYAVETLAAILADVFARNDIDVAMTHAYEGGHPDHDALALAVHLAAGRCRRKPSIIEMPYYHAGAEGWVRQIFADEVSASTIIHLGADAWARKSAMLDAHRSQAALLDDFRQPVESFRLAPTHDFMQPPTIGRWLYEHVAPTLHPEAWLARARAALAAEGCA